MTHIWIPKFKILEGGFKVPNSRVEGLYTFTRRKADTMEVVQQVGPFKNLLTNQGLNRVGTGSMTYIAVGTGTNAPSVSDTGLQAIVAYSSTSQGAEVYTPAVWGTTPYSSRSITVRFAVGAAAGNLSEVALGWVVSGTFNAGSRARIVDSVGSPTTITVFPDEVLDVTYELRNYMYPWEDSDDDIETVLTLSGVNYDVVMRPLDVNSADGLPCNPRQSQANPSVVAYTGSNAGTPPALAAVTASAMLTGGASGSLARSTQAYVNNSWSLSTVHTAALNAVNLAYGIRGLLIRNYAVGQQNNAFAGNMWQATVTPAIPKDATNVLSFGSSYSWGRYTP